MSSKIKVDTIENVAGSGNVSLGSGHNLVVPGNQTVGGTLSVTGTSALTGVVTIDGSNALSTASGANAKLNVGSLSGTAAALNVNVAGTDGAGAYRLINATDGQTTNFLVKTDNSASENRLEIGPETGSAIAFEIQGSEKMKLDVSGRVTTPQQPAFRASRTAGNYSGSTTEIIVWNNVIYNQGSHYDNSNGRFTAPVAGIYQFNVMGSVTGGPQNAAIHRVRINGSYQADVFPIATSSASHISYANSFMLNLSANDYIDVWTPGGSVTWYGTGNVHNHFSGFLVG